MAEELDDAICPVVRQHRRLQVIGLDITPELFRRGRLLTATQDFDMTTSSPKKTILFSLH